MPPTHHSWANSPALLVAGGGIAGVSAAVAAARAGADVLLIEQYADLGGTATVCAVGAFCGETTGQGEVFDDIVRGLEALGAIQEYKPYTEREFRKFDHERLKVVLQELALAARVRLLLHTRVVDAAYSDGHLDSVTVHTVDGLLILRPRFAIDATGDAALVHAAGLPTMKGREADGRQLPPSLIFFIRDVGHPVTPRLPAGLAPIEREADLPMTSFWDEGDGRLAVKMKVIGFDTTDPEGLTNAEIESRRQMMRVLHFIQRTSHPTYDLDYVATQLGIREGRRVVGEYILTEADLRAGRRFDDAIARGCFYLDAHDPATPGRTYQTADRRMPPYQIPLRCLRPRGAANVLVAGRCLSADQMALSSCRVMTTASMIGQAAGLSAAQCVRNGADLSRLDVPALQAELEARGATL